jgi:nucleotide-binding universal stress UspA family protein
MYKTIIWGTDGSSEADRALPTVIDLATRPGAKLTVVHVDEHFYGGRSSGNSVFADEPDLREKIQKQVDDFRKAGIDTDFQVLAKTDGEPADAIAEIAGTIHADVIVVATRGHGRLAGALLGSVAQRLLHVAPCPVLVITPHAAVPVPEPLVVA